MGVSVNGGSDGRAARLCAPASKQFDTQPNNKHSFSRDLRDATSSGTITVLGPGPKRAETHSPKPPETVPDRSAAGAGRVLWPSPQKGSTKGNVWAPLLLCTVRFSPVFCVCWPSVRPARVTWRLILKNSSTPSQMVRIASPRATFPHATPATFGGFHPSTLVSAWLTLYTLHM